MRLRMVVVVEDDRLRPVVRFVDWWLVGLIFSSIIHCWHCIPADATILSKTRSRLIAWNMNERRDGHRRFVAFVAAFWVGALLRLRERFGG